MLSRAARNQNQSDRPAEANETQVATGYQANSRGNAAAQEQLRGTSVGWGDELDRPDPISPGVDPTEFDDPVAPLDNQKPLKSEDVTLEIANNEASPSGDSARTKVGIGEASTINSNIKAKDWKASAGTSVVDKATGQLKWTAPTTAGKVTITAQVENITKTLALEVVEPTSVTASKTSETTYDPGVNGAGLRMDVAIGPSDVSFLNLGWAESQGAIVPSGKFVGKVPTIQHNSAWSTINASNQVTDIAETYGYDNIGGPGAVDYKIDQHYRVGSGAKTKFATVTQRHEVFDAAGTAQTSKAGASSEKRKG